MLLPYEAASISFCFPLTAAALLNWPAAGYPKQAVETRAIGTLAEGFYRLLPEFPGTSAPAAAAKQALHEAPVRRLRVVRRAEAAPRPPHDALRISAA